MSAYGCRTIMNHLEIEGLSFVSVIQMLHGNNQTQL